MEHKIDDYRQTLSDSSMPVTFDDAEALNPFDLARLWGDRLAWPLNGAASDEVAELACMSALARWLDRWQPIHIHRAVLAGAEPEGVAAALGGSVAEAFGCWHRWAAGQREVVICGKPGVTAEEYETVVRVFAAAGVTVPGGEPRP
jgi:hypothetical protein